MKKQGSMKIIFRKLIWITFLLILNYIIFFVRSYIFCLNQLFKFSIACHLQFSPSTFPFFFFGFFSFVLLILNCPLFLGFFFGFKQKFVSLKLLPIFFFFSFKNVFFFYCMWRMLAAAYGFSVNTLLWHSLSVANNCKYIFYMRPIKQYVKTNFKKKVT